MARHFRRWKLVSPSGLSTQVVWFDDMLWGEGPVMFRTELEAWFYIQFVLLTLTDA